MKNHLHSNQGRITVTVPHLTIEVGTDEATNAYPFLVRAKFSHEPFLPPLEEDPGCPEWFAFDGLYCYDDITHFATKDGVVVTVKSSCDLLLLLTEAQLEVIENIVLRELRDENEPDVYEPMLDYQYGI